MRYINGDGASVFIKASAVYFETSIMDLFDWCIRKPVALPTTSPANTTAAANHALITPRRINGGSSLFGG